MPRGERARPGHRPGRDHVPPPVHTRSRSRSGKRQNALGPPAAAAEAGARRRRGERGRERENGGGPVADQTRHPLPAHLSQNARSAGRPAAARATTPTRGPGDAPPGEKEGHSHRPERGRDDDPPSAFSVNDPSAGSPTETLLRLLLPLDSQVRPSSQRSARAVGRPRRGRSEGLTKPSNR